MIAKNIESIKRKIPSNVKLIAVSKTKPINEILEAYNSGHKIFGENKVQELASKYEELPKDIEWHLIGHLQTNKVKYIASFISLIHSVDSMKLLETINKEAQNNNRIIDCLLQVKIAREETKYGLSVSELKSMLLTNELNELKNIKITGLMGMATYTDNENEIRNEFRFLSGVFKEIKNEFFCSDDYFRELSMGMSHDYLIAIEEGSTMIRTGSIIFGERYYS